jgi:mRNA-degrading endonuclease RelE of RelBE toxin-antitoxin system
MTSVIPPGPHKEITPRLRLAYNTLRADPNLTPEKYKEFLGEHGHKIASATRERIKELTGYRPEELSGMASTFSCSTSPKAERIKQSIHSSIAKAIPFLNCYKTGRREEGLKKIGDTADDFISSLIKRFFNREDQTSLHNDVALCNDVGTLTMMAYNENMADKLRFEASRKLLLMEFMGEAMEQGERYEDHNEAMNFLNSIFNQKFYELPEGAKIGENFEYFLVAEHGEDDMRAMKAEIRKEEPVKEEKDTNTTISKLRMRMTSVEDPEGRPRQIHFAVEPRSKTLWSRLIKAFRYNQQIGEESLDRNGIRMIFASKEDMDDFLNKLKDTLEATIRENFQEQLNELEKEEINDKDLSRNRKKEIQKTREGKRSVIKSRMKEENVLIYDVKDSLETGEAEQEYNPSKSKKYRVKKFKLNVGRANGRRHTYEFQCFLPDGYADTKYRHEVNWAEYEIRRFFEEGIDELLFPSCIYNLDREGIKNRLIQNERRRIWNGSLNKNGEEHTEPMEVEM